MYNLIFKAVEKLFRLSLFAVGVRQKQGRLPMKRFRFFQIQKVTADRRMVRWRFRKTSEA
jgi:hypothetical protein